MTIEINTTVDILDTIRKAVDASTLQVLGAPAGFFIQGDVDFILTVLKNGVAFDLTTLEPDLLLSITSISEPDAAPLVLSTAPSVVTNVATFSMQTATVELQAYLEGALGRDVIIELVDNTTPATPEIMARYVYTALNQGYNAVTPVYANLQHKIAVDPDRIPLVTDDASEGYSLGSIWLYHNIADPANADIFACKISTTGAAQWFSIIAAGGGGGSAVWGSVTGVLANQIDLQAALDAKGTGDMTQAVYDPATIAEQLVGLVAAQTLTNKTLTAPVITGAVPLTGTLDIIHTATEADDHALEIDCDAAGFGDVKAIDIPYTTGAMTATEEEAVVLVSIDESSATGGEVVALEVLATEGSANPVALLGGVGVDPVIQFSGTFADMDSALVDGVDKLAEFISAGSDVQLFPADNGTVTIGNLLKFEEIEFLLAIAASGSGIAPTFEYSTGIGTWASFTPTDGTNGFRNSGIIVWNESTISGWATGLASEYLIRITRTRNTLTTPPTEDLVQIAVAINYTWDKAGKISVKDLNLTSLTASEMLITNGSKDVVSAPVATYPSLTELAYVKGLTSALQTQLDNGVKVEIGVALSDETTDLETGLAKVTFRMPYAMTLTDVRASVTTAPTGSVLTVDINESAVSILSTKLTIDATEKTSETAATPAVISDSALADDAEITMDIDTIGSTIAGTGLKVWLIGTRT